MGGVGKKKAGDWKLGGFELVYDFANRVPPEIRKNKDLLKQTYQSVELARDQWDQVISSSPVWGVDAWCLACLIYECFNRTLVKPQDLTNVGKS